MQMMKWSALALAVAAGTSQVALASAQSESKGFIEDSKLDVFSRALYMNRDFRNGAQGNTTSDGGRKGYREETGLGVRVLFESGFTQGTVGVGVDAHSLTSVILDSGKGRTGTGQFATDDSSGNPKDNQTEVGGAIKFRVSDTVLKYGNQFVASPVFSTDDSRILPEVATGTYLVSNEIENLELSAGRFTGLSSQTQTTRDDFNLPSGNIFGASYQFSDNFSGAIHTADFEDYHKKSYLNLNYNLPLAEEQSLNFDFNAYRTTDQGKELAGEIDNKIWSLAAAYNIGAHTFTLAHQRSSGDSSYIYGVVDGGGTVWLANSVQLRDFELEDERSWQARYDLDMATFGVPGLSFMGRYVRGDNINDTLDGQEGKRWERNLEAKYVIQEGTAKDLSFRIRQATYRTTSNIDDSDMDEVRLIVEYPLSIL